MKDWKYRQHQYHLMASIDDDIKLKQIIIKSNTSHLAADIITYFEKDLDILIYPSKSYAVAIIYAKLLEHYFNEDFYKVLDDSELLYNNDKFFKPYLQDKQIYDDVIRIIDLSFTNPTYQVQTTIEYFKKEFFINTYKINL